MHLRVGDVAPCGTPAHRFDVYLDGERLDKCFEADDEAGYARCYATDDNGQPIVDGSGEDLVTVTKYGKVEFRKRS